MAETLPHYNAGDSLVCELCGEKFASINDRAEAESEAREVWGDAFVDGAIASKDDDTDDDDEDDMAAAVVCDVCYGKFMHWFRSQHQY